MTIFAVLSDGPNQKLEEKIKELFPFDNYKINDSQWLIDVDTIAQELATRLETRGGAMGRVLVLQATSSGSGWQNRSLWDWLTSKNAKT